MYIIIITYIYIYIYILKTAQSEGKLSYPPTDLLRASSVLAYGSNKPIPCNTIQYNSIQVNINPSVNSES